jgi:hypothetical protein
MRWTCLAAGGAAVVALLASANPLSYDQAQVSRAPQNDMSAARKTVRVKRVRAQPVPVARFRPADPSFDEYGRLYRPPPGLACPIDLGYGRFASCSGRW